MLCGRTFVYMVLFFVSLGVIPIFSLTMNKPQLLQNPAPIQEARDISKSANLHEKPLKGSKRKGACYIDQHFSLIYSAMVPWMICIPCLVDGVTLSYI